MSSTIKAQVLSKAIELWADPKKRIPGKLHDGKGGHCAMGVPFMADGMVRGLREPYWYAGSDRFHQVADLIGMEPPAVVRMNNSGGPEGRAYLYDLMKDALAKELA